MPQSPSPSPEMDVHSYHPPKNMTRFIQRQTDEYLTRLIHQLGQDQTQIDELEAQMRLLATKAGLDFEKLSSQPLINPNASSSEETGGDLETQILNTKLIPVDTSHVIGNVNYDTLFESERGLLLTQIQRQMALTRHLEKLLDQYQSLLQYTLDSAKRHKRDISIEAKHHLLSQKVKVDQLESQNDQIHRQNAVKDVEIQQCLTNIKSSAIELNNYL